MYNDAAGEGGSVYGNIEARAIAGARPNAGALVYFLPVYHCLPVYPVYPVYHPGKHVYVYRLLFTTPVNTFTFTAFCLPPR